MNKYVILMLGFISVESFAQSKYFNDKSLMDFKRENQETDGLNVNSDDDKTKNVSSSDARICGDEDQVSLPLKYLYLFSDKSQGLEIVEHNPEKGSLKMRGPMMMRNCYQMIQWDLDLDSSNKYYIEASLKSYKPTGIDKEFPATIAGYEECLEATGAIKDGKVNTELIDQPIEMSFNGASTSGDLYFKSTGNLVNKMGGMYDKPVSLGNCHYSEKIAKENVHLYSVAETKQNAKMEQYQRLCKSQDYKQIDKQLENFKEVESLYKVLSKVRDDLLLKKIEEVAKYIKENDDFTNLDLTVIQDFKEKIIQPKVEEIKALYSQVQDEKDISKKSQLEKELKIKISELKKLRMSPYILDKHLQKLWKKGPLSDDSFYESVLALHEARTTIKTYEGIGKVYNDIPYNLVNIPKIIKNSNGEFSNFLKDKRLRYEIRNNERDGLSDDFFAKSQNCYKLMQDNQVATQENIQAEMEIMQRKCRNSFNKQNCMNEHMVAIQELQQELLEKNNKLKQKAEYYQRMGSSYLEDEKVANKNKIKEEQDDEGYDTDNYVDDLTKDDGEDNKVYKFDFKNPYAQNEVEPDYNQFNNQWYQQQNPYMYYNPNMMTGNNNGFNPGLNGGFQFGFGNNRFPTGGFNGYGAQNPYQNPYMMMNQQQQFNPYGNYSNSGAYNFNYR
jgi:hypothetical protein